MSKNSKITEGSFRPIKWTDKETSFMYGYIVHKLEALRIWGGRYPKDKTKYWRVMKDLAKILSTPEHMNRPVKDTEVDNQIQWATTEQDHMSPEQVRNWLRNKWCACKMGFIDTDCGMPKYIVAIYHAHKTGRPGQRRKDK